MIDSPPAHHAAMQAITAWQRCARQSQCGGLHSRRNFDQSINHTWLQNWVVYYVASLLHHQSINHRGKSFMHYITIDDDINMGCFLGFLQLSSTRSKSVPVCRDQKFVHLGLKWPFISKTRGDIHTNRAFSIHNCHKSGMTSTLFRFKW
jgi:hypothetical protein